MLLNLVMTCFARVKVLINGVSELLVYVWDKEIAHRTLMHFSQHRNGFMWLAHTMVLQVVFIKMVL